MSERDVAGAERIWLQQYGTSEPTGCADKIDDSDIEYVRADLIESQAAEIDRLRAENAQLHRGNAQGDEIGARMRAALLDIAALCDCGTLTMIEEFALRALEATTIARSRPAALTPDRDPPSSENSNG